MDIPNLEFEISDVEWRFIYATLWRTIDSFDDVESKSKAPVPAKSANRSAPPSPKPTAREDKLHVSVTIGNAVLVTTTQGEKLAQFSIHGVKVDVEMEGERLEVDGRLHSVLVRDVRTNSAPLYQTILGPIDKTRDTVAFSFKRFAKHHHHHHAMANQVMQHIHHSHAHSHDKDHGDWDSYFTLTFRKVEIVAMVGFILMTKDLVLVPIFERLDLEAARAKDKQAVATDKIIIDPADVSSML